MGEIPIDPYVSGVVDGTTRQTSIVLHWTRTRESWEPKDIDYDHVAWGALSLGPSMQLPPQYEITALRRVPYNEDQLLQNLYDPSNGTHSLGLLYCDTMGNRSRVKKDKATEESTLEQPFLPFIEKFDGFANWNDSTKP